MGGIRCRRMCRRETSLTVQYLYRDPLSYRATRGSVSVVCTRMSAGCEMSGGKVIHFYSTLSWAWHWIKYARGRRARGRVITMVIKQITHIGHASNTWAQSLDGFLHSGQTRMLLSSNTAAQSTQTHRCMHGTKACVNGRSKQTMQRLRAAGAFCAVAWRVASGTR